METYLVLVLEFFTVRRSEKRKQSRLTRAHTYATSNMHVTRSPAYELGAKFKFDKCDLIGNAKWNRNGKWINETETPVYTTKVVVVEENSGV